MYVAHAQNSFHHFRAVETRTIFGLLAVAAFQVSSNLPTAECGETVTVAKGDEPLSRLHT